MTSVPPASGHCPPGPRIPCCAGRLQTERSVGLQKVRRLLKASCAVAAALSVSVSVSAYAQSYRDVAPQTPPSTIKRETAPPRIVESPQATQVAVPSLTALI